MLLLITGVAGFIGFHISRFLVEKGHHVIGIDNMNGYYDPSLKEDRLSLLRRHSNFEFYHVDLKDKPLVDEVFDRHQPEYVINLAAQAGVRYSVENPYAYVDSNLIGFMNVLEACRRNPVKHLIYASSSSVYGGNKVVPLAQIITLIIPFRYMQLPKSPTSYGSRLQSSIWNPYDGTQVFYSIRSLGKAGYATFRLLEIYCPANLSRFSTMVGWSETSPILMILLLGSAS